VSPQTTTTGKAVSDKVPLSVSSQTTARVVSENTDNGSSNTVLNM
jgi:hypothetical protein